MEYVYFALAGLAGGLLGGMGMGGGTVLIPLLSIFMNVDQHAAQALNLISFLPMAVVAHVIHFKNGLVNTKSRFSSSFPPFFSPFWGVSPQKIPKASCWENSSAAFSPRCRCFSSVRCSGRKNNLCRMSNGFFPF